WLYRIAANVIADRARRHATRPATPALPDDVPQRPNPYATGPDEVEEAARLYRFVRTLPDDQRRVILLRFVGEKSIREIAEELGRTEGAVKQLQFRALKTLRARMEAVDA